ncbi:hypothetical protein PENSPDRAFT_735084 [Peniophora sp. CONT]|nr:hypothetical protein PENSPDRAFT_735084 [Peniophora sp. CONT]
MKKLLQSHRCLKNLGGQSGTVSIKTALGGIGASMYHVKCTGTGDEEVWTASSGDWVAVRPAPHSEGALKNHFFRLANILLYTTPQVIGGSFEAASVACRVASVDRWPVWTSAAINSLTARVPSSFLPPSSRSNCVPGGTTSVTGWRALHYRSVVRTGAGVESVVEAID